MEPDARIAAVDDILCPIWYRGTSWTLEVQGKALSDRNWVPFWTRATYVVTAVDKTSAKVTVSQDPYMRGPGFIAPDLPVEVPPMVFRSRGSDERRLTRKFLANGQCVADIEFWLPLRLVRGELREPYESRDQRRSRRTAVSYTNPPRTGTSPCIPLVPRHPMYQPTSVVVPKGAQSIEVTDDAVTFTIYEAAHHRITWLKGHPWWALMERVGSSQTDYPTVDERRPDRQQVHRARLIAIDGGAIEPLPWSDEHWLRDNWPAGGLDEEELPRFDEIVPHEAWAR